MQFSTLFARHFARLVWLLLHEPSNINEQKSALRAMVALSKFGAISVESRDWQVVANGVALPDSTSGATELVAQMAVHGIRALRFAIAPAAAHVLGIARFLATRPAEREPGQAAIAHLRTIGATTVSLVLDEAVTVSRVNGKHPTPPASSMVALPFPESPLAHETKQDPPEPPILVTSDLQDSSALEALPHPHAPQAAEEPHTDGIVADEPGNAPAWLHFSAAPTPSGTPAELFARLDRFQRVDAVTRVLDELVTTAENGTREGRGAVVAEVFHGIVAREASVTNDHLKRAYAMAVRRMARPALLRAVAHLLPEVRERRADYIAVLVRTGEDGADALIDQLTQAQTAEERRVFFDVLLHLQAGVPTLIHMLGDARWFVARNAAVLLGEMKAADAEEPLKQLLKHHDDRVRRAATNALVALDTTSARQAVYDAMKDGSAQVRMQAASALAAHKDAKSAGTLTRALDDEVDSEVQVAILSALGKVATPEAVLRLIKAAEPDNRMFFKRKTTAVRLAAVQALAEARTPAAMAALWELIEDKDKEVREAVQRLVGPLRSR